MAKSLSRVRKRRSRKSMGNNIDFGIGALNAAIGAGVAAAGAVAGGPIMAAIGTALGASGLRRMHQSVTAKRRNVKAGARLNRIGTYLDRAKKNKNTSKVVKVDATTVRGTSGRMYGRRAHYRRVR